MFPRCQEMRAKRCMMQDWKPQRGERWWKRVRISTRTCGRQPKPPTGPSLVEQFHVAHWEELPPPDRALLRSQCGPLASAALTALPICRATLIESQPFRFWLCRRLPPSFSPPPTADVAADWTSLATVEQLARGWGCWGREVSRWSAPLHKCAEMREDVLQPTWGSAISTLVSSTHSTIDGWR